MKRREFLETGLTTAAGATAFVSGLAQLGCAAPETARQPGPDLAISVLDDHEAETPLKMSRQVYPHDHLDDSFYWKVVVDLDAEASTTPATLRLMREGIATLDETAGEFIGLSSDSQVAALKKIESSEFFQKVRGTELGVAVQQSWCLGALWVRRALVSTRRVPHPWLQRPEVAARPAGGREPQASLTWRGQYGSIRTYR